MTERVARGASAHSFIGAWSLCLGACAALLASACAAPAPPVSAGPASPDGLYQMPASPAEARSPDQVRADHPGDLAEAALGLVNPERPGGADYAAAARLALLAIEQADPRTERDLIVSCFRFAARSALRSGEPALYLDVVDRWDGVANEVERVSGEYAVHAAIRARVRGTSPATLPSDVMLQRMLGLTVAPAAQTGRPR